MALIYKIFRSAEHAEFMSKGETLGAPIDLADGYIHLSTAEQVEETAAKHFSEETGLMLLGIDADSLGEELKWEPSRGGALFPHLYRELRTEDVAFARALPLNEGQHDFGDLES